MQMGDEFLFGAMEIFKTSIVVIRTSEFYHRKLYAQAVIQHACIRSAMFNKHSLPQVKAIWWKCCRGGSSRGTRCQQVWALKLCRRSEMGVVASVFKDEEPWSQV